MSETSSRLLQLLSLLQGRRDWPGNELSERLLVKEVIEAEEFRELLGPVPPKSPDALPAEIPPPGPLET